MAGNLMKKQNDQGFVESILYVDISESQQTPFLSNLPLAISLASCLQPVTTYDQANYFNADSLDSLHYERMNMG